MSTRDLILIQTPPARGLPERNRHEDSQANYLIAPCERNSYSFTVRASSEREAAYIATEYMTSREVEYDGSHMFPWILGGTRRVRIDRTS